MARGGGTTTGANRNAALDEMPGGPVTGSDGTTPGAHRLAALDGLRGVAVLSVMAYHLVWAAPEIAAPPFAQGGWVGVDVFFVLSGFLIGGLLLTEIDSTGGLSLPRFFARRILRLYPAMVAFLVVGTWFAVAKDHLVLHRAWGTLQSAGLYYLNVELARHLQVVPSTFAHLWTLSVEFHFYLMLPVLFLALHAVRAPRWAWAGVLTVAAAVVAVNRSVVFGEHASFTVPYVSTFTRLDALLVGVLLALFRHQGWLRPPSPPRQVGSRGVQARQTGAGTVGSLVAAGAATAGAAWLAFVVWTTPADQAWLYHWGMVVDALAAAAVIWFLVARPAAVVARVLASPVPRWLGQRSYALYLCHYVVYVAFQDHLDNLSPWVRATLAPLTAFAIAELSYRLVESPALKLKARLSRAPAV